MMAEKSNISWTHSTFNPWIGCTKVSPGCANCYAENLMDTRYGRVTWGPNGTRSRTSDSNWREPLKWNLHAEREGFRHRVFCASLADVFEDWPGRIQDAQGHDLWLWNGIQMPDDGSPGWAYQKKPLTMDDLRRDLFRMIDQTPWLDWLLLTKRPEHVRKMWASAESRIGTVDVPWRTNVWLGTSIESQEQIGRWDSLARCQELAPVLWISAEPLLGPIDVSTLDAHGRRPDWIVFGGESNQGQPARPCDLAWIRSGVQQCRELGIVPFVKQLGSNAWMEPRELELRRHQPGYSPLRDKAGANPDEWPEDLRVREFPEPANA